MRRFTVLLALAASFLASPPRKALAGPPLVCHPIEIGPAASLPFGQGPYDTEPGYDRSRLVADTLGLLGPEVPVLVRMETIRRASIYATKDAAAEPAVAQQLLMRLLGRVLDAQTQGKEDALALFDAGYALETF